MSEFRVAVQLANFAQPLKKALHTAAQTGCDGIQIDARTDLQPAELSETGLRELRKILSDLNLRVGSVSFTTRGGLSSSDRLQQRVEATITAMRFASSLDARVLVCTLGQLPEEESSPQQATLVDVLDTLANFSHKLGVSLAAQTGGASPHALARFFESLPEGAIGLDLHPGQLLAGGQSPREFVESLGQFIFHIHAVDAVRDLATGQSDEVQLGRGTVEFPDLMGLMEEHRYRNWLTIERRQSSAPGEDVSHAVAYLRSL